MTKQKYEKGKLKPIFILGSHKSGTSLLRSLFDGHPDFQVLPVETHLFEHMGYEITYALRRQKTAPRDLASAIEKARQSVLTYNSLKESQGDAALFNYFDLPLFDSLLNDCNTLDEFPTSLFDGIYQSFYGKPLQRDQYVVEKSVEHHEFVNELLASYPNARFIHIVRNPYANVVALRKYTCHTIKRYPYQLPHIKGLKQAFENALLNDRKFPKIHKIIKFEELVASPASVMRELCDFLNVRYTDHLTIPTVKGALWKGNSTSKKSMQGIEATIATGWIDEINPFEIFLVNKFLSEYRSFFNYSFVKSSSTAIWKPGFSEQWKEYLKNRFKSLLVSGM